MNHISSAIFPSRHYFVREKVIESGSSRIKRDIARWHVWQIWLVLGLALLPRTARGQSLSITTLAGEPFVTGSANGPGLSATFNGLAGVAVDLTGNLYIADRSNCTIRKITPLGVVSTLAGTPGNAGASDGTANAAQFNNPRGVAVDQAGNVYVADTQNATIRKITPAGVVSTIAGQVGKTAIVDGTGTSAEFEQPWAIAVDSSNNIYVTDSIGVRKISSSGVVSTLAGGANGGVDGTGGAAGFFDPRGIAVDSSGNIYVADTLDNTIRKVTPGGVVTTLAGSTGFSGSADGLGSSARFNSPYGLVIDAAGNLFVADSGNATIRRITSGGVVTTVAGTVGAFGSSDGVGPVARFDGPQGMAIDSEGDIFITDVYTVRASLTSPQIMGLPQAQVLDSGATLSLNVSASGFGLSYQWKFNGVNISGATSSALTISNIQIAQMGNYSVVVSNEGGSVTSTPVVVTVNGPPVITAQPISQTVAQGASSTATFSVAASGATNYQWEFNGAPIVGATSSSYTINSVSVASAGNYTIIVTNGIGSVTSAVATLVVTPAVRLTNLSTRAQAGIGSNVLTVGFSLGGSGNKELLVRGIGPALAPFGVAGFLINPQLTLYNSAGTIIAVNDDWGVPEGSGSATATALASAFAMTGAFLLPIGSLDSALLMTVSTGTASAAVTGTGGSTGIALAEIYDADTANLPSARLINLSARAFVGSGGSNSLVAGFVIGGTGTETILIRGIGPALTSFNVSGALTTPILTVFDNAGAVIGTTRGWDSAPLPGNSTVQGFLQAATLAVMNQVSAFGLAAGSSDCALVATLPSGSYSASVSGVGNTTGVALVEVYEVPQ